MLPGPALHGCCLVSFHFLWAFLCPQAVLFPDHDLLLYPGGVGGVAVEAAVDDVALPREGLGEKGDPAAAPAPLGRNSMGIFFGLSFGLKHGLISFFDSETCLNYPLLNNLLL